MFTLPLLLVLAADPVAVRVVGDPPAAVEVTGLPAEPADPASVLAVVMADGTAEKVAARRPLLGAYSFKAGVLRFEPRFPFAAGVRYRATLTRDGLSSSTDFAVPKPKAEPGSVAAVYPSADQLPENTLRLYVQFSKPMSRGDSYRHVKLVNETDGKDVVLPFLRLDEELWTDDRTRFTLLIDPGRIKREVKPRDDLGTVLAAGKRFTLVIDKAWPDADGTPLATGHRKAFTVSPPDHAGIDPAKWAIAPPDLTAKPVTPLAVRFEKPLDRAVAARLISVVGPDGKPVAGESGVSAGETGWWFRPPNDRWPRGAYRLVIDPRLEDPCGNRVGEPFEVDVQKPVERKPDAAAVERGFEIR